MALTRFTLLSVSILLAEVPSGSPAETQLSPEVLTYTISLIQHLANQQGIADCWFYESSSVESVVLEPLLTSERLAFIPKRLLSSKAGTAVPVHRQPAIGVIYCEQQVFSGQFLASDLDHFMKIVVFYRESLDNGVVELFKSALLYNVVYVRVDRLEFYNELVFRKERVSRSGFVSFDEVFLEQTRDVGGYQLKVSTFHYQFYVGPRKMENYDDVVFVWVGEAAARMNGSVKYHTFDCNSVAECTIKSFAFNKTQMYDFCLDGYSLEGMMRPYFLDSVLPSTLGIAVPRGRELTAFEIFVAPFTLEAWIGLVLLIAGCATLKIFQLFENDLVLFALCSFERRNLYKVSGPEKIVLTALVFLFFIVTSAYESKMISLMTSIPRVRDPQSLDDLIALNISVKDMNLEDTAFRSYDDPRLQQIFTGNPKRLGRGDGWDVRDQTRAYFGSLEIIRTKMHHRLTYDSKARRSRYTILEQLTSHTVVFRPIHFRSPFRATLKRYERAFAEAGLVESLTKKFTRNLLGVTQDKIVNARMDAAGEEVGIAKLVPAWQMLAIGWTVSIVIAGLELVQNCVENFKRTRTAGSTQNQVRSVHSRP